MGSRGRRFWTLRKMSKKYQIDIFEESKLGSRGPPTNVKKCQTAILGVSKMDGSKNVKNLPNMSKSVKKCRNLQKHQKKFAFLSKNVG